MLEGAGRHRWVTRAALASLIASLVLVSLAFVGTVAMLVITALETPTVATIAPLGLAIVGEVVLVGWLFVLYGLVRVVVSNEEDVAGAIPRLGRIETLLGDQAKSSRKLADLATLSDQAKGLIFRERELEAFREAIHEDLIRQDYETALALIDGIEQKFGYADEAARLRKDVEQSRQATLGEKIDAAVSRIQESIDRKDWGRAIREGDRVLQLFPDNPKVASLPGRIQSARSKHKRDLLQAYGDAVRKNDVDRGIDILKELDTDLTPQEAAALEESARGVFRAKLHQLGVQFAIRVTEENWPEAITVGETIVSEFPNTRMAHEVRQKMGMLRARAEAQTAAT